jgi:hypothetical protein
VNRKKGIGSGPDHQGDPLLVLAADEFTESNGDLFLPFGKPLSILEEEAEERLHPAMNRQISQAIVSGEVETVIKKVLDQWS